MRVNASLIKQCRTERSWTQQHLADACDVSLRTIQRVERYGTASNETLMALAAVLEVEQSEIQLPEVVTQTVVVSEQKSDKSRSWFSTEIVSSLFVGFVAGAVAVLIIN